MPNGDLRFEPFVDLIDLLQSYYPRNSRDDPRTRATQWLKPLSRWPLDVIEQAVELMPEVSPQWFPPLGVLIARCRIIAGDRAKKEQDLAREERQAQIDHEHNRLIETMPDNPEWQQEYIDMAPNPCERLGRQWEVDSKLAGRRAHDVISVAMASARFAALFEAMDSMGEKNQTSGVES